MAGIIGVLLILTTFKKPPSAISRFITFFSIHVSNFPSIYGDAVRGNTIPHGGNKPFYLVCG